MAQIVNRVVAVVKPNLTTFLKFAKVELTPPKPGDIGEIVKGFKGIINGATSGAYKNVTVKEAFLNTLVTTEVLCWFFIGECIGKANLVGYEVERVV